MSTLAKAVEQTEKVMFEVVKGKPIPTRRKDEFPWDKMELGDSFFVPCEGTEANNVVKRVHSSCTVYLKSSKKDRKDFSVRTVFEDKDGKSGIWVWRLTSNS
jgi:hypothetical protein